MDDLLGKVSIVTGAAMGIGREIALRLARDGSDVVVVDIEKEPAQEVVKEIQSVGRKSLFSETDVARWEQVKAMVDAVVGKFNRVDILINNAGIVGPVVPVARSVGRKRALELLLYGELIKADRAAEMGLVNRVVPAEDLEAETHAWASALAGKSPIAVQIAKKAYYSAEDLGYEKSFAYMNEAFARLCSTEDAKEGVNAFLEKRVPQWQER